MFMYVWMDAHIHGSSQLMSNGFLNCFLHLKKILCVYMLYLYMFAEDVRHPGARVTASAHPAGRAGPLPGGGRRGGPCVRARTHPERAGRRRPPATGVESGESGAGSGKGALRRPPRRTCPTWKTQIPVSNTWETFSPARSAHAPRHPSSRRRPRPHRIHAPHRPGPGGGGPRGRPARGRGLSLSRGARVAEGTAGGGVARAGVWGLGGGGRRRETLLGVWHSVADLLGGAARRPGTAGWWPAPRDTPGPDEPPDRSPPSNRLSREEPRSSRVTASPPHLPRLPAR